MMKNRLLMAKKARAADAGIGVPWRRRRSAATLALAYHADIIDEVRSGSAAGEFNDELHRLESAAMEGLPDTRFDVADQPTAPLEFPAWPNEDTSRARARSRR